MKVRYSVIIPAYNEESWLPGTLAVLRKAMDVIDLTGEIIVVDNNSIDGTAQIARKHNARVIFEPINQISRARNAGARIAKGDYLFFLDADTLLPKSLLQAALDNLSSGICCGGGALVSSLETAPAFVRMGMNLWNRLSKTFGVAAGCFVYCLQKGFVAVGGFSERVYASEEIWFSSQLKSWGKKRNMAFRVIPAPPIITSIRKLEWFPPLQIVLILFMGVFPIAVRFRSLCSFWYRRPSK